MEKLIPMEYTNAYGTPLTLGKGTYKKYCWTIISYGTHPCAYVELHSSHPLFSIKCDDLYYSEYITCHGGITFNGPLRNNTGKWLGWDYNHGRDFNGIFLTDPDLYQAFIENKKWNTEEIYEEVKNVIEQLIKLK